MEERSKINELNIILKQVEFSGALETPVNPEVAPAMARWIKD